MEDNQKEVTVFLGEGDAVVVLAPSVGIAVTVQDFLKEINRYEKHRLDLLIDEPEEPVGWHLEFEDVVNLKKILQSINKTKSEDKND